MSEIMTYEKKYLTGNNNIRNNNKVFLDNNFWREIMIHNK